MTNLVKGRKVKRVALLFQQQGATGEDFRKKETPA